jgi:hypothetical protein
VNLLFRNRQEEERPAAKPKKHGGKHFTKGYDPRRNLSGRPKLGTTLAARYRDALMEAESEARGGEYTKLDAMIDVLMEKALDGDQRAIEYLQERGFGKVPDRLELSKESEDEKENPYDYSRLTREEVDCWLYLMRKASGQEPRQLEDWVGTERRHYRFVLTKEYIEAPALPVIEGELKE